MRGRRRAARPVQARRGRPVLPRTARERLPRESRLRQALRKAWHFLWEDNSVWSWLANIALAFVLIKFIVYPGLGLLLGTSHPVVAVVSCSMKHTTDFDSWWEKQGGFYESQGIGREEFSAFAFQNGFNKGDIMILKGTDGEDAQVGDVIVFRSLRTDPIIHRAIKKTDDTFVTKGDNNPAPLVDSTLNEYNVRREALLGKAFFRIPLLGYIKIIFVTLSHPGDIFRC